MIIIAQSIGYNINWFFIKITYEVREESTSEEPGVVETRGMATAAATTSLWKGDVSLPLPLHTLNSSHSARRRPSSLLLRETVYKVLPLTCPCLLLLGPSAPSELSSECLLIQYRHTNHAALQAAAASAATPATSPDDEPIVVCYPIFLFSASSASGARVSPRLLL